ncbi:MmgE/PrpD family protein [Pelagibius sp. CAU 1746]|uniref:MmgE/PrpD family protein n=1 Tax=Pelagibius sp. CAU 1746 TaxID=3140370 RepID=UPI00325B74ED
MSLSTERELAQHIAGLRYDSIPDEAIDAAKMLLHDTVVDIVASLRSDLCRSLRDTWSAEADGPCALPGTGRRTAATTASFINGVFAHWYEWDDVHFPSILHASAVLYPVLLAAGEVEGRTAGGDSWREFISATVASFDVAARVSESIVGAMHNGWMPTSTAAIGAAGGAARLLGLDVAGIHSAMGIAASTIGVSRQAIKDRVNGKNVLCGLVAETAMRAALLARSGIEGPSAFVFGDFGAATLFADRKASSSVALSELGKRFSVTESSIKLYPCCYSTHGSIDATLDLVQAASVSPDAVEKIEIRLPQKAFELVGAPFIPGEHPRVAAQFSAAYAVALTICRGAPSIDHFDDDTIRNARDILSLVDKVEIGISADARHEVQLRLVDGSTRVGTASAVRGSPQRPASKAERQRKTEDGLSILDPRTPISSLDAALDGAANDGIGKISQWISDARTSVALQGPS